MTSPLSLALAAPASVTGHVPAMLVGPFILLLGLIAAMPLPPPSITRYWDRYYAHVAIGLGLLVANSAAQRVIVFLRVLNWAAHGIH